MLDAMRCGGADRVRRRRVWWRNCGRNNLTLFYSYFEGDRDCNMEMLSDVGKVDWIRLDTSAAVEGATSDRMPAG